MSRPSRGFSGTPVPSGVVPACPSAATLTVEALAKTDWQTTSTWLPDINVGTINLLGSINGGDAFGIATDFFVDSGWQAEFDPFAFGGAGDVLQMWVEINGATGCPDFSSNIVTMVIES